MGNPTLFYPGDEPDPCWTCAHFEGFNTRVPVPGVVFMSVNCAQRGRFFQVDPDRGCRQHEVERKSPGHLPAPGL